MRVLITSAGKKVTLVKGFQKAGAYVIAQDLDIFSPACMEADEAFMHVDDIEFDLLVPTRDAELIKYVDQTNCIISSKGTLKTCTDKAEFYRFCRRHGFDTPVTAQMDMIAKPRNGSGSRGIIRIDRSYICQEIIDWPEYSIDYFSDFDGNTISVIPRKRLKVVDGESQDCEIVEDSKLIDEATRLGQELKIIGPATMQCFYDKTNIKWIEVNPRFGGGSHFTWHLFNAPRWLLENYQCMLVRKSCITSLDS